MHVDFDQLPEDARVWVYQASRQMTVNEINRARKVLESFTNDWAAHGSPLRSSFKFLHDRFVLIAVDEGLNMASGCSIDSSVHVMKLIGDETGIDFFDRTHVPFLISEDVVLIKRTELKEKYRSGVWNGTTRTFNTLAQTVREIRNQWLMEAEKTWLRRYMQESRIDSLN